MKTTPISIASAWLLAFAPPAAPAELAFPPKLPRGQDIVTDTSDAFLQPSAPLDPEIRISESAPTIDFLYYPGQDYPGNPWSVWGDGLAVNGKYYSAIGDHLAPRGNAFLYEYDPASRLLQTVVNLQEVLNLPPDHYTPGKIHSRIDLGRDGWLYFSTHRGSTRVTTDQYHYKGDWIIRHHPDSGATRIVTRGPVPNHCIPTSVLDPDRLIFYGGTAAGDYSDKTVMFFAYDIRAGQVRYAAPAGPYRYLMFARSTGRVYYVAEDGGPLMRYDPDSGEPPVKIAGAIGIRSATQETADGFIYTVSTRGDASIWRFNTRTEAIEKIGHARVGTQDYVASLDVDPSGRFLYYVPGAHGGGERDGSPVVQFDVRTGQKKVVAFLHPFYRDHYGYTPLGTFGSAIDPAGDKLYITWNGNRAGPDGRSRLRFDTCALTIVHIPESER